jgi:chemotaxis-related protein WspD
MGDSAAAAPGAAPATLNTCWTTIGVRGDGSCPELQRHVHCRNCPVYSAGAMQLLDANAPADYLAQWTRHVGQSKEIQEQNTESIVIFRVGSEWLALPTPTVTEVTTPLPIHTLPHRSEGVILGLASVHGELLICVSLGHLLGLAASAEERAPAHRTSHQRLLVIRREQVRAVCPVDEVHGIHRFHPRDLKPVPSTVAKATSTFSRTLLSWRERSVGLLDDGLLFHALKRSMA